jgi:hypothetical protein
VGTDHWIRIGKEIHEGREVSLADGSLRRAIRSESFEHRSRSRNAG